MTRIAYKCKTGRGLSAAVLILSIFAAAAPVSADSRVNLYGALGFPTPNFDAPSLDLGIEAQLGKRFYLQFIVNTLIGSPGYDYRNYGYGPYYYHGTHVSAGGIDLGLGSGNLLYGLSSYGVFKFPVSRSMNLWVKGGLHFTFYDNFTQDDDGYIRKNDANGLGSGFGAGFEHNFSNRFGVFGGIIHKTVWWNTSGGKNLDDNINWWKLYTGIIFRVSRSK